MSGEWRPSCLGLNMLTRRLFVKEILLDRGDNGLRMYRLCCYRSQITMGVVYNSKCVDDRSDLCWENYTGSQVQIINYSKNCGVAEHTINHRQAHSVWITSNKDSTLYVDYVGQSLLFAVKVYVWLIQNYTFTLIWK